MGLDLAEEKLKFVGIKFESLTSAHESAIWSFITKELAKKSIAISATEQAIHQKRENFRVMIRDLKVKVITEYTKKIPQQEFIANVEDLSVGGICISLPRHYAISKGGTIYLNLDFCQAGLSVRGTILGLRRE